MNHVALVGRLTKDPETRYTQANNTAITRFTVAVDRRTKEQSADFISCTAFGKTAEFVQKYFAKGMRIGLTGRIQTGSYTDRDGKKIYTTDVIAETVEFVESKKQIADQAEPQETPSPIGDGFMQIPDNADDAGLPWN